jgi:hypothetical protein
MGRILRLAATFAAAALALPAAALAGNLTLHPSGFGEKSYAAWKTKEGQTDSHGNGDQALYFQKNTSTFAHAAGVALFKGFAGLTLGEITGLEWEHRNDGHCGAGAPRWTFISQDTDGRRYVTHLGCAAAVHSPGGTSIDRSGTTHTWTRDTYSNGAAGQPCQLLEPPLYPVVRDCDEFEIVFFGIIFDEGVEHGQCANLPSTATGRSCVHLDNIKVAAGGTVHCWTSASDNGNKSACDPIAPPTAPVPLGIPALSAPVGVALDLTDIELVSAVTVAFPRVALSSWSMYPDVY